MALTVLIVDDHDTFRACARACFEAEGLDVVGEAVDGGTALAAASELEPDVILLDVQLPDIDGFEVAERLQARGFGGRIVLTSSRDGEDFGPLVVGCGARGFVPKGDLSRATLAPLLE
ncbi:MAG: response regulator transcription factor [Actinomycetota bacterium]|nr:response regulator transcription factor [Actinomycetota bacterium]